VNPPKAGMKKRNKSSCANLGEGEGGRSTRGNPGWKNSTEGEVNPHSPRGTDMQSLPAHRFRELAQKSIGTGGEGWGKERS